MRQRKQNPFYELFMLLLSMYVLMMLGVSVAWDVEPDTSRLLSLLDALICFVFLGDFFWRLWYAPDRWRYFLTWGWLDLISSIPFIGFLRMARIARVVRILRLLRGLRSTKWIILYFLERRTQSMTIAMAMISITLLIFSSIAILYFEKDAPPGTATISSAGDALWWALVTMTTVGYGDKVPVTPGGRVVAAMLMIAGIGLFGTFTGLVASWFLHGEVNVPSELERLRQQNQAILKRLEKLERESGKGESPQVVSETEINHGREQRNG